MDCRLTERQLADLERSIAGPAPSLSGVVGPSSAAAATSTAPVPSGSPVRGVTDTEIRFAIAAPFSGSAKELGRQMKLGIDTAFNRTNDAGVLHQVAAYIGELPAEQHSAPAVISIIKRALEGTAAKDAPADVPYLMAGLLRVAVSSAGQGEARRWLRILAAKLRHEDWDQGGGKDPTEQQVVDDVGDAVCVVVRIGQ